MNTPFPCDMCINCYCNILHEDDPSYTCECTKNEDMSEAINGCNNWCPNQTNENKEKEIKKMTILRAYVKKIDGPNKDKKVAAMCAMLNKNGEIVIGHSTWHKSKDEYNPKESMRIALARAEKNSIAKPSFILEKHLNKFAERAKRYFKDSDFSMQTKKILGILNLD